MNILNENVVTNEIGGDWGCYIGCAGGCLITNGVGTAMVVAVWTMA